MFLLFTSVIFLSAKINYDGFDNLVNTTIIQMVTNEFDAFVEGESLMIGEMTVWRASLPFK